MIVGLSGYARSGKDESAKALVNQGFERRAFADKLREFLYRLDPIVDIQTVYPRAFSTPQRLEIRVSDVIERYGWDGYKDSVYGTEMRQLMQRLGTECGRQLISDTVWIDAALGSNGQTIRDEGKVVVTDVRFQNEFEAIQNRGGMNIRIVRPGVGPANDHPSETALDGYMNFYDAIIVNSGSINELHDKIRRAVAKYF